MSELFACIKKECFELLRGKKLIIFFGIAVVFVVFNIAMLYIMTALMSAMGGEAGSINPFSKTVYASVTMYSSYLQIYYTIPVIFMVAGAVAKEIKQKKWVLPVCSGIRTENMVGAKFLVYSCAVAVPAIVGFLLNTGISAAAFAHNAEWGSVFLAGFGMVVTVLFYTVLTIALSALTKSRVWAAVAPIAFMLILQNIFGVLKIANYTPFLFSNLINAVAIQGGLPAKMPTAAEWAVGSAVTVLCMAALIFSAVKNRRLSIV